ncbi:hypothetical protein [Streptomyces albicerus]|uniref:hypothetical protein n=1 Tax=Streptomyces albicerus TaxID=2569859 RepID=UPI00124B0671|nr:hypothetical protein [Streptomyces albicerus]
MHLLLYLGGGAGALLAIGACLRAAWRVNRRIVRIADLVTELSPNEGHSIKDAVDRMDGNLLDLTTRFEDHLRNHLGS